VANYREAVSQLAQITTRSTLGAHTLDQLLGQQDELKQSIRKILDERTESWGVEVQNVEIRSVDLDPNMIRAMGQEAEAERGRRARVITAQGEFEAATKLAEAAQLMEGRPGAMLLRYLATLKDIAVEHNSTIIFPIPSDIMAPAAQGLNAVVKPAK
ncbi:MAG: slipin family protein, partial [Planctomycetia bacterium]|nr:slipin family protein [Planctomycetia bacterium]